MAFPAIMGQIIRKVANQPAAPVQQPTAQPIPLPQILSAIQPQARHTQPVGRPVPIQPFNMLMPPQLIAQQQMPQQEQRQWMGEAPNQLSSRTPFQNQAYRAFFNQ